MGTVEFDLFACVEIVNVWSFFKPSVSDVYPVVGLS